MNTSSDGISHVNNKKKHLTFRLKSGKKEFINPNSPQHYELVFTDIPAGTFIMGSPENEIGRSLHETQRNITISAFSISKYEITNAQFAKFLNIKNIGENGKYSAGLYPNDTLIHPHNLWGLIFSNNQWIPVSGYENYPVINVSWHGASEFANYNASKLPTEAQWEYVCRAGTISPFNTGYCINNRQANYRWENAYGNCSNNDTPYPASPQTVGSYPSNAWGVHDLHGNVREWCADWYGCYQSVTLLNPEGPSKGTSRIIRGGSWYHDAHNCRSAHRFNNYPAYYDNKLGFRIVRM